MYFWGQRIPTVQKQVAGVLNTLARTAALLACRAHKQFCLSCMMTSHATAALRTVYNTFFCIKLIHNYTIISTSSLLTPVAEVHSRCCWIQREHAVKCPFFHLLFPISSFLVPGFTSSFCSSVHCNKLSISAGSPVHFWVFQYFVHTHDGYLRIFSTTVG